MKILLVLFFLSVFADSFALPRLPFHSYVDTCRTEKDSLTGRKIYRNADIEPEHAGGQAELLRRMDKGVKGPESALRAILGSPVGTTRISPSFKTLYQGALYGSTSKAANLG
jgi:hypothetical protein